jgi:hypothetical protein
LSNPTHYGVAMPINSQRWFVRKEDYEPRKANSDSPFRRFDVKCLKCSCYKLTLTAHFDEQSGETILGKGSVPTLIRGYFLFSILAEK